MVTTHVFQELTKILIWKNSRISQNMSVIVTREMTSPASNTGIVVDWFSLWDTALMSGVLTAVWKIGACRMWHHVGGEHILYNNETMDVYLDKARVLSVCVDEWKVVLWKLMLLVLINIENSLVNVCLVKRVKQQKCTVTYK